MMNWISLAMSCPTRARLTGLVLVIPPLLLSPALGQSSFKSAMGAGVLDFGVSDANGFMILIDSGDYNSDGLKDFLFGYDVVASEVMVALGQGGDQFEIVGPMALAQSYEALSAGDRDGDGSIEFLTRDAFVVRIIGSEPGEIETEEPAGIWYLDDDLSDPTFRSQVYFGDLDGDGGTDFVFNTTGQRVLVRWSSRDQSDPYETVLVPEIGDQNMIFPVQDYDGDGDLDILVYDEDSTKFILIEGNGTNTMGSVRVIDRAYPRIGAGDRPLFGQFDDDPAMDLVIHDLPAGTAGIVLGFVQPGETLVDLSVGEPIIPIGAVGDLDGSGAPDLVVMRTSVLPLAATTDMQGALLVDPLGGGGGLEPMVVGVPFDEADAFRFLTSIPTPRIDSIDLDSDGDLDLLWFGYLLPGTQARVTLNRTEVQGVPRFGATYIQGRRDPLHVLAVDLDGDSVVEAIVTGEGLARVYNLSDGTSDIIVGSANSFMSAMADLEGDGNPELVLIGRGTEIKVYAVNPDGTIGARIVLDGIDLNNTQAVVVADFNLDGRDDLAVTNTRNIAIQVLLGVEGPGLEPWGLSDGGGSFAIRPAAFDFTGDGFPDLAIGDINEDQIRFYQNNNDGTFTLSDTIGSQSPYWLIAGDVDLDGNVDLVSASRDGFLNVYFFDDAGEVEQWVELAGIAQVVEVIAEDFVGSSLLDLAVATSGSGLSNGSMPLVWEQVSPRAFEIVAALPGEDAPGIAGADVNNDGAMDILTVSDLDRSLLIHWGTPTPCLADLTGDGTLNFYDVSAFVQAFVNQDPVADFTGDGVYNFFDVGAFLEGFEVGCP